MSRSRIDDLDLLERRTAAAVGAVLSAGAQSLPADVVHRLGRARAAAMARVATRAPSRPRAVESPGWLRPVVAGWGGWSRAAAWLPLLVLVVGLVLVDELTQRQRVVAAADVDAALLADELPPEAYGDEGFVEFLRTAPRDAL